MRATAPAAVAIVVAAVSSCSATETFPEALFGSWAKETDGIALLQFSEGGRVDITLRDGTRCSGDYGGNWSETEATIESGYISCPGLMDGYATTDFELSGDQLVGNGTWGGTYDSVDDDFEVVASAAAPATAPPATAMLDSASPLKPEDCRLIADVLAGVLTIEGWGIALSAVPQEQFEGLGSYGVCFFDPSGDAGSYDDYEDFSDIVRVSFDRQARLSPGRLGEVVERFPDGGDGAYRFAVRPGGPVELALFSGGRSVQLWYPDGMTTTPEALDAMAASLALFDSSAE